MEEIIIQKQENFVLVCVLENGEIVERYNFDIGRGSTIGNIYIGTVKDIFDGMQAAFVELGLEKKGFLSLKDAMPKIDTSKYDSEENRTNLKLSKILQKDQNVLLQVRKEAFEDKGPRVSTHITLAGNYLVLMPKTDIITISQKINTIGLRTRIRLIIIKMV
jgi:ribonuclease G